MVDDEPARLEGKMKAINERLDRMETNIETLLKQHLGNATLEPAAGIHGVTGGGLPAPVAPPTLWLRHVTANTHLG